MIRRRCCQLIVALLAAVTCHADEEKLTGAQILTLEGEPLFKAAFEAMVSRRNELSDADVLGLTERLAAELPNLPQESTDDFAFHVCFEDAARNATGGTIDRLATILASLGADQHHKGALLPALAGPLIERELAAMKPADLQVKLGGPVIDPPEKLRDAPADLVNAWQQFKRARRPMDARVAAHAEKPTITFQKNRNAFFGLVDDVTLGRGENLSEQLLQYGWGGWCGTGADSLAVPQSVAVFIALLRERKIAEAIGASLDVTGRDLLVAGRDEKNVRIEFLKRCGFEWESVLAGAQLDAELESGGFGAPDLPFINELAAYGSDRAASLLEQLARRADGRGRIWYARALRVMVAKPRPREFEKSARDSGATSVTISGAEIKRFAKQSISSPLRGKLLDLLEELAQPNTPTDLAEELVRGLGGAWEQRSIPALRRLAEHPSPDVMQSALWRLRTLGEKVELPREKPPVRFRVMLNGERLPSDARVGWQLRFGDAGTVSSVATADADGIIGIDRDNFADPERPVSSVVLSTSSLAKDSASEPIYQIELPLPADLDEVTTASAVVLPCNLILRSPPQRQLATDAKVMIRKRNSQDPERFSSYESRTIIAAVDVPVALPPLQPDTYELEVAVPGALQVKERFVAEPGAESLDVQLSTGTDVRVEFVQPNGVRDRVDDRLFSNFQWVHRYRDQQATYRGLPPGNYEIHVASSDEAVKASGRSTKPGPDETPYQGRKIAFTITEDSPPLIDLGAIQLEAVPR